MPLNRFSDRRREEEEREREEFCLLAATCCWLAPLFAFPFLFLFLPFFFPSKKFFVCFQNQVIMHVLGQVLRQLQGKGWLTASAASAASAVNPLLSAPLRSEGVACASSFVSKPSIVFGRRQQKLQKWFSTTTTTGENDDDEDGKELEEVDLASVQDQVEQMQEQMDEHLEEQEVDEAVRASSLPEVFDDPTDIPFKG